MFKVTYWLTEEFEFQLGLLMFSRTDTRRKGMNLIIFLLYCHISTNYWWDSIMVNRMDFIILINFSLTGFFSLSTSNHLILCLF